MDRREELTKFLRRGDSFGLPGVAVSCIETHCSEVYIVGNRAYKLKRPIAFSAVDYRTLAQREAACRSELELNRHAAPELYLGLHSIRRRGDGTLRLDGEGEIVDWLVAMRRFDQADLFDHLAAAGRLTPSLIRSLADEIARVHGAAEATPRYGGAAGLRAAADRNRHDMLTVAGILLDGQAVDRLHAETMVAIDSLAETLDARRTQHVRRVHGDLRLANICLVEGRATLFDAIEFGEALSCIDVLYDLAFLLVDLQERGQPALANIVLNRYLDVAGDDDGIGVLPLMLSVRAATRAYTLAGSAQRRKTAAESAKFATSANAMLALASRLLHKTPPRLVAVGGLDGSRKNRVVEELAVSIQPQPGARVLRSEQTRRQVIGLRRDERLNPAAYDPEIGDSVYDDLCRQARRVLAAGRSVVIEASFFYSRHRRAVEAAADAAGVPLTCLWLGPAADMGLEPGDAERDWPTVEMTGDHAQAIAVARQLLGAGRRR